MITEGNDNNSSDQGVSIPFLAIRTKIIVFCTIKLTLTLEKTNS